MGLNRSLDLIEFIGVLSKTFGNRKLLQDLGIYSRMFVLFWVMLVHKRNVNKYLYPEEAFDF